MTFNLIGYRRRLMLKTTSISSISYSAARYQLQYTTVGAVLATVRYGRRGTVQATVRGARHHIVKEGYQYQTRLYVGYTSDDAGYTSATRRNK